MTQLRSETPVEMAYLSDIDLATLHKKRLDEKNHYKLSWYNRRFYDDEMSHHQHQSSISLKHEEHKVKSKAGAKATKAITIVPHSNTKSANVKAARVSNDVNDDAAAHVENNSSACTSITNGNRNRSPDFYDEGYFSSPTLNRRRSGTWP